MKRLMNKSETSKMRKPMKAFTGKKTVRKALKGFTLMEILAAIAVVGLLTAIAIPAYQQFKLAGVSSRKAQLIDAVANSKANYFNDPSTSGTAAAAWDTMTEAVRFTTLTTSTPPYLTINGAAPASLVVLTASTGYASMTLGNSTSAPTIP